MIASGEAKVVELRSLASSDAVRRAVDMVSVVICVEDNALGCSGLGQVHYRACADGYALSSVTYTSLATFLRDPVTRKTVRGIFTTVFLSVGAYAISSSLSGFFHVLSLWRRYQRRPTKVEILY